MKTLKEQIAQDIEKVIFNTDEFAEKITIEFPPDEPFKVIGILSICEDTWKKARIPTDPQKESVILQINAEPFKEYIFVQGSEVKINGTKYFIENISSDEYIKEFLLRRNKL